MRDRSGVRLAMNSAHNITGFFKGVWEPFANTSAKGLGLTASLGHFVTYVNARATQYNGMVTFVSADFVLRNGVSSFCCTTSPV